MKIFLVDLESRDKEELSILSIKGQLISKGLFGVFNSSKKRMKTSQPEVS